MDIPRGVTAQEKTRILLVDDKALDAACLVANYRMADHDGISTLTRLRTKGSQWPAILATAFPSADMKDDALAAGFEAVLEKPLRKHVLLGMVQRLVRQGTGG